MGLKEFFSNLWKTGAAPSLPARSGESVAVPRGFLSDTRSTYGYSSQDGGAKWDYGLSTSGSSPTIDHHFARQNSRSAYLDSMQAHAIVNRSTDTTVDTGLRLKPKPAWRLLGITAEQAREWSRDVEERFELWAKSKKAHRSEQMTFYQMQRMVFNSQQRDGEYFIRFTYQNRKDLVNPLQLRVVDPNQVNDYSLTATSGFNEYSQGIVRDQAGKETAYKIYNFNKRTNSYDLVTVPAVGPKSGRRMMIHGFTQEWPDQVRGYPRLFHALQEFENVTDFSLAQIKKAINQSNLTMFVEPSDNAPASNPWDEINHNVAEPVSTTGGAVAPASDLTDSTDYESRFRYIPIREATVSTPGSVAMCALESGETIKPFANTAPSESFGIFVDSFMSHLSASMSIPLEVVLMKFGQNYSASRAALILFWRVAQIWRDELANDFLKPVYEEWLAGEIAAGRIQAPGWSDPMLRQAWGDCYWSGVPMPNIDPEKTARAEQTYIEMGAQTLQDVAMNLNGSNAESNKAQLREELEDLPVPPWAKKSTSAPPEKASEENNEDG